MVLVCALVVKEGRQLRRDEEIVQAPGAANLKPFCLSQGTMERSIKHGDNPRFGQEFNHLWLAHEEESDVGRGPCGSRNAYLVLINGGDLEDQKEEFIMVSHGRGVVHSSQLSRS